MLLLLRTSDAFRLVNAVDSLRNLGSLPPRKMQSGAVALIRQSGSILDIAIRPLQPGQLSRWLRQSTSCSLPHGRSLLSGCQLLQTPRLGRSANRM